MRKKLFSKIKTSLKNIKFILKYNYINLKGIKTVNKYVVFESDDWGSIRTSSIEAYDIMIQQGDPIDSDLFTKYDSLASEEDLKSLFSVLNSYKDLRGRHPIFTINCSVANPDFKRIKLNNFEQYYYESFLNTLASYPEHKNSFKLWKEGIEKGYIFPQLHCREHLNIERWMEDLRSSNKMLRLSFDNNMISGGMAFSKDNKFAYMDAFGYPIANSEEKLDEILNDAVNLFEQIFGFRSISFVPCCHVWNDKLEKTLKKYDIKYIQGANHQLVPSKKKSGKFKRKRNYLGKKSKFGQTYLIRNCSFEPTLDNDNDVVERCLKQIEIAFKHKKPAIINTHRLNYIGYIHPENREKNLIKLAELIEKILDKWPDVEFITTVELIDRLFNNN